MNNQWFSKVAVWLVIALVLFTVFKSVRTTAQRRAGTIGYSDFLEEVRNKHIKSVDDPGRPAAASTSSRQDHRRQGTMRTTATYLDRGLIGDLINNGVKFDVKPREEPSPAHDACCCRGPRCCC